MEFKGFDDWIEVFLGGKQVDSQGREHDGDAVIDKAVETFNASEHEPPIVIGHPDENAPAYGWVEGLKSVVMNGQKRLFMKARAVVPEFEDMVKRELFKKRSISVYPDGRLRHVGFLGAAPPAVKGLADLTWSDDEDAVVFDFYDDRMGVFGRILRNLRDWFIEKEGKERADAIIPDWDVDYIKEQARNDNKEENLMPGFKEKVKGLLSLMGVDVSQIPDDALPDAPPEGAAKDGSFSEADVSAAIEQAKQDGRKEAEAEFAETARKKRRQSQEADIAAFCDAQLEAGKLLPAWMKMGLKEFMLKLDGEEVVAFSDQKKASSLDWFKDFMAELPKVVEFKEIAGRDTDVITGSAGAKLDQIARKKMADGNMDYGAAFSAAQVEYPELAREYAETRK